MIAGTRYSINAEVARQQKLSEQISQIQTNISSGVKVHVASDDPVAARRIAQIRSTQASQETWSSNITLATQVSSQVEDSLNSVQTILTRAKELMLSAKTQTAGTADRTAIATELQAIIGEVNTISQATDFTGTSLYAQGNPVAIPVGPDLALAASAGYQQVFGTVPLSDGTTTDMMTLLSNAVAAIQSGDQTAMTTSTDAIDSAQAHVSVMLTDAGVRTQRIEAAQERLETAKLDLTDERSSLEDTDVTSAAAELVQKQTQLSAAQSILAQLAKNTLFDKLA